MTPILQFLLSVAVIITAAKLAGLLAQRLGQPAVLGEILAGLLLGPSALDLLALPFMTDTHLGESVSHLAEVGVVFLMFIAGLEVDLSQMRRSGRVVLLGGIVGVVVPLLMGWAIALPFGYGVNDAFYIGMLLTATSVSISAQTLLELGVLRSRVGIALLGAAVVDDVLVILLLSVALAMAGGGGNLTGILWLLARMLIYLAVFSLVGWLLLPRLLALADRWWVSEGLLAATVVIVLFYAWGAEAVGGIALITGAFLAGIFLAGSPFRHRIEEGMHTLAYSFFVPIFFVNIGLHANIWELTGELDLAHPGSDCRCRAIQGHRGRFGCTAGRLQFRRCSPLGHRDDLAR